MVVLLMEVVSIAAIHFLFIRNQREKKKRSAQRLAWGYQVFFVVFFFSSFSWTRTFDV